MAATTRCSNSRRAGRGLGLVLGTIAVVAGASCGRADAPPDLSGTWGHQRVFGIDFVCPEVLPNGSVQNAECAGVVESTPEFPAYKPEFQARVAELRARQVETDTVLRCHPPGVPRIGPPAKIVQSAADVVFLYDDPNGSFFRVIPIDGRGHREGISASYLGDAVGRFEGDTLVVETTNFTDETWLTDNGAFHTRRLRVVERLRRVGDGIEYRAEAHDPDVLMEPWQMRPRTLTRSDRELEEPPRCEERDLDHMVDPSQFHDNPR